MVALLRLVSLLLLAAPVSPQDISRPAAKPAQPVAADPEASADGRATYLGREVAHTMHWTGAPWLLRATREDEENGAVLQRWLAVKPEQAVCDLGCGNGYHTLPLARAVGPRGKVFAVDIQREMLQLLAMRAKQAELDNVELIEGAFDDPKLPENSCDLVLLVDVYHELSHPVRVLRHVREALRPGGRVVLVEFRTEDPEVPIKPEHKMSKAQVAAELADNGFRLDAALDELPWQHALAFVRNDEGPRASERAFAHAFLATCSAWSGHMAAMSGAAARELAPFLAARVQVGPDETMAAEAAAARFAAELRAISTPLPPNAVLELQQAGEGKIAARLDPVDASSPWLRRPQLDLVRDSTGRLCIAGWRAVPKAMPPFAAMHTGTGNGSPDEQAGLLRELGYAGICCDVAATAAMRRAHEQQGLDVFSAYAVLDVGAERIDDGPVRAAMAALSGGPGMIWLCLQQRGLSPSDRAGDARAAAALAPLLALARTTGVELALYPHHDCWLETAADALRLCEQIADPNLGLCFNLCHFLRDTPQGDAIELVRRSGSHLFSVTVNGADKQGTDWATLIQPLDRGNYDLQPLLRTLSAIGYRGPIGLQAFGIQLPPREHLTRSMAAWQALQKGK